jgi:ferredoxin-NADP reductase
MWQAATIVETLKLTPRTRMLTLDVPGWTPHRAGQHIDVRLTAEDGYQAARSYSLASVPGGPPQITVDRLPDGEVSPYLVDVAAPVDQL